MHTQHGYWQPGQQGYWQPVESRVVALGFSQDGSCMASLDLRPDAGPHGSAEVWGGGEGEGEVGRGEM